MSRTTTHTEDSTLEPGLLTVEEAARYLSLSRSKTYQLIRSGVLPTIRIGLRSRRISRSVLLAWIEENTKVMSKPEPESESENGQLP